MFHHVVVQVHPLNTNMEMCEFCETAGIQAMVKTYILGGVPWVERGLRKQGFVEKQWFKSRLYEVLLPLTWNLYILDICRIKMYFNSYLHLHPLHMFHTVLHGASPTVVLTKTLGFSVSLGLYFSTAFLKWDHGIWQSSFHLQYPHHLTSETLLPNEYSWCTDDVS